MVIKWAIKCLKSVLTHKRKKKNQLCVGSQEIPCHPKFL